VVAVYRNVRNSVYYVCKQALDKIIYNTNMPSKEEMIKGLDAMNELLRSQEQLRRDGLIFIYEQGMWKKFMKYHHQQYIERMGNK